MNNKRVYAKLVRGLLDLIVLKGLEAQPMHGYQIMTGIRKNFGVSFGASTVYPLLNGLERGGYVESEWQMNGSRPRKVYRLTVEGKGLLSELELMAVSVLQKCNDKYRRLVNVIY